MEGGGMCKELKIKRIMLERRKDDTEIEEGLYIRKKNRIEARIKHLSSRYKKKEYKQKFKTS